MEFVIDWCMVWIVGLNLFYSYIGLSSGNMLLFYIIKDDLVISKDWLLLGYRNNELILLLFNGGIFVDKDNNGLIE